MLFRLELARGVAADRLTWRRLQEWKDYYAVEPWGCVAEDYRMAFIAWKLGDPKTQRRTRPADFMPEWIPPRRLTPAEYKAKAKAFYARFNAQHAGS